MDDRTLESLCSDFNHAITLSHPSPEKGDGCPVVGTPTQEAGNIEGNCDLVDKGSASDNTEDSSFEEQTLPIFLKLEDLSNKVQVIRKEHTHLCEEVKGMANSLLDSEVVTALQNLSAEHELLKNKCYEECELLKKKYLEECSDRKKLYNEVIELKGNIRVFCRCRPLKQDEIASGSTSMVDFDLCQENELQVINSDSSRKQFKLDHVFRPEDNQEAVFLQTMPVVTSVLDGYNVCIFAYGQTGTGKTYTMEGTSENRGVNYRTLEELFKLSENRSKIMRYDLSVSMLEVYNEKIRDLLVENSNQPEKRLEIKQSAEGTQEVPGLVEARVFNTEDVWRLLKSGSQARSVGSTNANELSSRSHCLLRVTAVGENLVNGQKTRSHLWLVDLAGSERVGKIEVEGDRLKESQFINKSLSALGDVISALASKTSHVPYRNSKLTHLLQSSLGGDCKTLMFVQISPSAGDLGETLCSLNFASRVRGVEHGPARRQQDHRELLKYKQLAEKAKQDEKEMKRLQDTVQSLQLRLVSRESNCRNLQEKVHDLETQLAEERKIRLIQENRAFTSISTQPLASNQAGYNKASMDKKPPLAPARFRPPLRKLTNFLPVRSSPVSKNSMSILPVVNEEEKENRSRGGGMLFEGKARTAMRARRGSIAVRPSAAASSAQFFQPKRRASVATFQPESSSSMRAPLQSSRRTDRGLGRQSFVLDPQRVWRTTSRLSSPQASSRDMMSTLTVSRSSNKFRGSPPSQQQPGLLRPPKHSKVIALQKKHVVWSPLKAKTMKSKRSSMLS